MTMFSPHIHEVVIRSAREADAAALQRLAELDSATTPAAPVLVAESRGELRAAVSLRDGAAIADPFVPSAEMVALLRLRERRLNDRTSHRWLRALRTVGVAR